MLVSIVPQAFAWRMLTYASLCQDVNGPYACMAIAPFGRSIEKSLSVLRAVENRVWPSLSIAQALGKLSSNATFVLRSVEAGTGKSVEIGYALADLVGSFEHVTAFHHLAENFCP